MTPELIRSLAQAYLGVPKSDAQASDALTPIQAQAQAQLAPLNNSPFSNQNVKDAAASVLAAQNQDLAKDQESYALRQKHGLTTALATPVGAPATAAQAVVTPVPATAVPGGALTPETVDPTIPAELPSDDTILGPDGLPLTPQALAQEALDKRNSDLRESAGISAANRRAAADTAKVEHDIQVASQKPEDILHQRIEQNYNELHAAAEEVDQEGKAALAEYKQVQEEMKTMALAQPQDIWGQSGVNKVLGAASIFFGGYGVNGNHANHNLEMINALADRAVAAQKTRFENLKATGEASHTIYGMLQQRLQNAQAVSGTLKNMALESYTGMLRSIANQYADPKWKAAVETQAAKIKEEQNVRDAAIGQTYMANKQKALQLIGRQKAIEVAQVAIKQKEALKQLENGVAGYKGYMGNKAEHAKVADMVSGGRQMIASANHMENALNSPMTVAKFRQLLTEYALQFAGARKFLQTGTRIEEGEQRIIDALNLLPSEATMASLTPKDISGIRAKLDAIRFLIREGMDISVNTYAPGTMEPDESDPITGPWGPSHNPLIGDKETAAMTANGANARAGGQSTLDALPNADGTGNAPPAVAQPPDERFAG